VRFASHGKRTVCTPREFERRRAPKGSDGFTLIELIVAISLLAIVGGGFVASLGLGFQTIALARQRQTAASIAEARLEHLRSVPYAQLALPSALTQSTDPANPDSGVSADGTKFDVDGHGSMEPLVVDPAGGVLHLEDPVQVGTTVMQIYQYVTWVDDPAITGTQDYKRLEAGARVGGLLIGNRERWWDHHDRCFHDDGGSDNDGGADDDHDAAERVPG
jgi:prepilin-type N-terminal cleavage/methylation domain-containing protein